LASLSGVDTQGRHFHVFLQLQIAGLNGAFLTGDLFNLFVFFEILLLASYALLAHGGGLTRTRAGLAYVILNLSGSSLFLLALGLTYGALGTLNMTDLAVLLPKVASADQALVRTILALLATVFVLKAALLPLGFWLPHVYTAATLPAALLFVIMTKVGVYALLRVATIATGAEPYSADLLQPWLPWLALGTIALGSLGALAATRLTTVIANLVMTSSGTLLLGVAAGTPSAHAATLFYLAHSTIVAAGLFLAADLISRQRGTADDRFEKGPRLANFRLIAGAYLVLGVAASGAPPLSGFLAKLMVMQAMWETRFAAATWVTLLLSGLVVALVLARAASTIFWEPGKARVAQFASDPAPGKPALPRSACAALIGAVAAALLLTLAAPRIAEFTRNTADQLADRASYVDAVLGEPQLIERERRP
jgi:multicomponent K+:H+ antiporter subunit D